MVPNFKEDMKNLFYEKLYVSQHEVLEETKSNEVKGKRFNIHKRALPTSLDLDQVVIMGVEEATAKLLVRKILKPKIKNDVVFYYDMVPVDPTEEEASPYYNDETIILEGGDTVERPTERTNILPDIDYKD